MLLGKWQFLRRCLLRQVLAHGRVDCTDCYCMLFKCYINSFNHILLVVSINISIAS